ncbi:hypothetical protein F5Y03DRAFT_402543 [Xylaria venustula]|nr:hypothetical protein F5Y03DRAFT_402543 [Xylaria venustula]
MADAKEALVDIMINAVKLITQTANALCHGCVLLARLSSRHSGFVVVSAILNSKAPLVVQLHLADSLRTPGAVDFAGAWVSLLCSAVVLDTASIADQIITRRLAITIVAGSQLDHTVALILSHTLHGTQQVVEATVDALGRWCQGAGLAAARGHGAGGDGSSDSGSGGGRELPWCAQRTRRAVRDHHARGDGRVVRILLERNFDGVGGGRGKTKGRGRASGRASISTTPSATWGRLERRRGWQAVVVVEFWRGSRLSSSRADADAGAAPWTMRYSDVVGGAG